MHLFLKVTGQILFRICCFMRLRGSSQGNLGLQVELWCAHPYQLNTTIKHYLLQGTTNKSWKNASKGGTIFDEVIQTDIMEETAYKTAFKEWPKFSRCADGDGGFGRGNGMSKGVEVGKGAYSLGTILWFILASSKGFMKASNGKWDWKWETRPQLWRVSTFSMSCFTNSFYSIRIL